VSFDVRPTRDLREFLDAVESIGQYFAWHPTEEDDTFHENMPLERMHAAFDDGRIVGGAGAFPFDLSVPGGSVPCGGVTAVGVFPTHRRRGALRAMMRAQLDDIHERGEPIAGLWSSEAPIYGRFGYGLASFSGEIELMRERNQFDAPFEPRGTVRLIDADEAAQLYPPVWESVRAERPGMFARTETWWRTRTVADALEWRQGAGPKRFALLELDGEAAAYAIYRHKPEFEAGASTSPLRVVEAMGTSPQAVAEIWRFVLDIDWAAKTVAYLIPPDHALFFLLAEPRRLRYRVADALWMRLVDVGAALSGRSYLADGAVVFDVRDAFCPWNESRWKLEDGDAKRTDADADIALDVTELGSAYLGGVSFAELAQAGRIEELAEGAVTRADAMFRWPLHPWCPEIF
jgi:predicted acetyltransferase